MKSLILGGGFGTRLYPLTINKAKALFEYKGKALITHLVDKIPPDIDILVSTNEKFEVDFRLWQDGVSRRVTLCVEPAWTEDQKFGAVKALNYWIKAKNISEDLLVIASDNYFEFNLNQFIASYDGKNALVAVHDIGDKSKATSYGVVRLDGNRIAELEEKPAQPKSSLIATACYIFPPRVFPLLLRFGAEGKKDNLGNLISYLIDVDEVRAYMFSELWVDVGSVDVYESLQ